MTIVQELPETIYSYDEYCELCADERREKGLIPHIKLRLPERTTNYNLAISICPECDRGTLDVVFKRS